MISALFLLHLHHLRYKYITSFSSSAQVQLAFIQCFLLFFSLSLFLYFTRLNIFKLPLSFNLILFFVSLPNTRVFFCLNFQSYTRTYTKSVFCLVLLCKDIIFAVLFVVYWIALEIRYNVCSSVEKTKRNGSSWAMPEFKIM